MEGLCFPTYLLKAFTQKLSVCLSALLIATYGMGLFFSLKTHRKFFGSASHEQDEQFPWPLALALPTLVGVTALVALVGEVFVESVQKAALTLGMSTAFVGFVVALVANNGKSAWFHGVLLLMVYSIFAVTLYLLPPAGQ